MRLPWRRRGESEREGADFARAETAAAQMRESLVPLNEQLHGLATHISSMRTALASAGKGHPGAVPMASLEAALAAAEATYASSLKTRDAIVRQAEELQTQCREIRTRMGALAARTACDEAALQAEDRVRRELNALTEATTRLEARLELMEG
jgi:hypothetical protein